jgi:hypothetical protein
VHGDLVPVVAAAAIAAGVALAFLRPPATVDAISVTNATDYDIAIDVRGAEGGWMPLSTAHRNSTTSAVEVIDQGDTWTFRLRAQGRPAGELHLQRDDLEAAGWAVEIPASTEQTLAEAGAQPPP